MTKNPLKDFQQNQRMIRELLDHDGEKRLTDWEINFLESLNSGLSEKQEAVLDKIWRRIFT